MNFIVYFEGPISLHKYLKDILTIQSFLLQNGGPHDKYDFFKDVYDAIGDFYFPPSEGINT